MMRYNFHHNLRSYVAKHKQTFRKLRLAKTEFILYKINQFQNNTVARSLKLGSHERPKRRKRNRQRNWSRTNHAI